MNFRNMALWSIIGLFVLFISLFAYTQIKVSRIERKFPPPGEFVSPASQEGKIHYLREGSGIPVVMLHGRDGALQEFTFSIFNKVANNYEAVALDRPGYGYSECSDFDKLSLKSQSQLINETLNELNIENPIMIGHSYGGAVMLQYLLDYPDQVRGAISLAGVAYVDEPPEESFFAIPRYPIIGPLITNTLVVPLGRSVAKGIYKQAFAPSEAPENYVKIISSLYIRPAQFTATAYELAEMHESVSKISQHYSEITVPVTIIFGNSDQMLDHVKDGRRLYEALPNARLKLIDNAGHKIHHTHPEIVMDAIDRLAE